MFFKTKEEKLIIKQEKAVQAIKNKKALKRMGELFARQNWDASVFSVKSSLKGVIYAEGFEEKEIDYALSKIF